MVHKCNDCFSMRGNLFSIIYMDFSRTRGGINGEKVFLFLTVGSVVLSYSLALYMKYIYECRK